MINYILISDSKNLFKKFPEYLERSAFKELSEIDGEDNESDKKKYEGHPDLVVVAMTDLSEKDMEKTKKNWPHSMIVILSKDKSLAWKAYELGIEDFILCPASEGRMYASIVRLKELFFLKACRFESADEQFFFIREKESLRKLKINDITFIQALGDYINIFNATKKYTVHLNLKHVIKKLPARKFIRVHRSYIVNITKIEKILHNSVYLNSHHIPIGEAFKKELNSRLNIIK